MWFSGLLGNGGGSPPCSAASICVTEFLDFQSVAVKPMLAYRCPRALVHSGEQVAAHCSSFLLECQTEVSCSMIDIMGNGFHTCVPLLLCKCGRAPILCCICVRLMVRPYQYSNLLLWKFDRAYNSVSMWWWSFVCRVLYRKRVRKTNQNLNLSPLHRISSIPSTSILTSEVFEPAGYPDIYSNLCSSQLAGWLHTHPEKLCGIWAEGIIKFLQRFNP